MKIHLFDVAHIINQIKRASPPKDKETLKFLNNLTILLDKNTVKKTSPLESTLATTADHLNEASMDLCFKRKELVKKMNEMYFEETSKAFEMLSANKKKLEIPARDPVEIEWDLKTMEESNAVMPQIFSKLQKARLIIEETIERNECISKSPNSNVDTYFGIL